MSQDPLSADNKASGSAEPDAKTPLTAPPPAKPSLGRNLLHFFGAVVAAYVILTTLRLVVIPWLAGLGLWPF